MTTIAEAERNLSSFFVIKQVVPRAATHSVLLHLFQTTLDEATDPWGIKVERVEM